MTPGSSGGHCSPPGNTGTTGLVQAISRPPTASARRPGAPPRPSPASGRGRRRSGRRAAGRERRARPRGPRRRSATMGSRLRGRVPNAARRGASPPASRRCRGPRARPDRRGTSAARQPSSTRAARSAHCGRPRAAGRPAAVPRRPASMRASAARAPPSATDQSSTRPSGHRVRPARRTGGPVSAASVRSGPLVRARCRGPRGRWSRPARRQTHERRPRPRPRARGPCDLGRARPGRGSRGPPCRARGPAPGARPPGRADATSTSSHSSRAASRAAGAACRARSPSTAEASTAPSTIGAAPVAVPRARPREQVGLVEHHEARLVAGAQLVEHRLDGPPVLGRVRVRGVDDLEQDVRAHDLLERRPERIDQLVRQLVDEAHRVGDDGRLAVAQLDLAARGVERREQLVLRQRRLGAGERVEQRALAGVGVADDGDRREQAPVAGPRSRLALLAHLLDALLELVDCSRMIAPVGLQLALAGSPRADAALGPREVGPEAGQARQLVLQLGELDLEAALVGAARAGRRCRGSGRCGRAP